MNFEPVQYHQPNRSMFEKEEVCSFREFHLWKTCMEEKSVQEFFFQIHCLPLCILLWNFGGTGPAECLEIVLHFTCICQHFFFLWNETESNLYCSDVLYLMC